MSFTTQQISNHPVFADVERTVQVIGFDLNDISKVFNLRCAVDYSKNGKDMSSQFNQKVYTITASNATTIIQRDESGNPVLDAGGKQIEIPAYDYVTGLLTSAVAVSLKEILKSFIVLNDNYKFFDN